MTQAQIYKETDQIIEYITELIYNGKYNSYLMPDIYKLVSDHMKDAVKKSLDSKYIGSTIHKSLINNIEDFAAGKNLRQYNDMIQRFIQGSSLTENVEAAKIVNKIFNLDYLQTEMNYINNSTGQLNKWLNYDELPKDDYYIRYVATKDELTRESHYLLDGTTLPASDPFWSNHTPPWDYNCRCTTKAVRKSTISPTELDESQELASSINNRPEFNIRTGLSGNIKQTGKLFTDSHPYIKDNNIDVVKRTLNGQL